MAHEPDDIRRYIRLTESSLVQVVENALLEDIEVVDSTSSIDLLLEDINDMIFKFRSYSETDGPPDYVSGVEEGLALAANMLERLFERHTGHSSK